MAVVFEYIPKGVICDVEGDVCYGVFDSEKEALDWLALWCEPQYVPNYRVVSLPTGLRDSRSL